MTQQAHANRSPSAESNAATSPPAERTPIAIVGIGCRFPGASGAEAFWDLLMAGADATRAVPADRWNVEKFYDPEPGATGKTNACRGGFIDAIDQFDAGFFNISPREAARMDPQQRLLLEVAWEAIADAGMPADQLAGSDTCVFVGISSYDYSTLGQDELSLIDAHTNTGLAGSIAANRISYFFNLQGPSLAVDTACSSSLVAVHLGCREIWEGRCGAALVGGVNVLIKAEPFIGFSKMSVLSPDGKCKAFDATANGFVRGEGAGMLLLKPLPLALRQGDRIYALIRGSATNQDGHSSSGMTLPSQAAQEALLVAAFQDAGVKPADVQYMEAHGTGTLVGDPIEANAIGAVMSRGRPDGDWCAMGSVKTNIGHLESAAGMPGIIKAALALKHRTLPKNLHFEQPNPAIPFEQLKLRVPTQTEPWPASAGPKLAGVNSFGFGGANAHVVLQEPPEEVAAEPHQPPRAELNYAASATAHEGNGSAANHPLRVLPLSARSADALQAQARAYDEFLNPESRRNGETFADICWTAGVRQTHHEHRLGIVARDAEEARRGLAAYLEGKSFPGLISGRTLSGPAARLVFVFSGQGPQWWAMGRQLFQTEAVYRDAIEECDRLMRPLAGWSLIEELNADEDASRIGSAAIAQPALFAVQVALYRLWLSWGIEPQAVLGHSAGEVAAAYAAGALSLEDAVAVIVHRGRCMELVHPVGGMLAASLSADDARQSIQASHGAITIAAFNSPTSVTLSGERGALEELAQQLEARGVYAKFLRVPFAFHSAHCDPVRDPLLESLATIQPRPAAIPMLSTVTGERLDGTELDADYWWRNVRQPVKFGPVADQLLSENYGVFLEIAPHPVLSGSILECANARKQTPAVIHSLRRGDDEAVTIRKAAVSLFTVGQPVDWNELSPRGELVSLPAYPWQRERHWTESALMKQHRVGSTPHPLLGERLPNAQPIWGNKLDVSVMRFLKDHCLQGHPLLPGTGYLEMALEAGRQLLGPGPYVLEDVELSRACFLQSGSAVTLQTRVNVEESLFAVESRPADPTQPWTGHAAGAVRLLPAGVKAEAIDLAAIRRRCPHELGAEAAYEQLAKLGLDYGPAFRGLKQLWCGQGETLAQIEAPAALHFVPGRYHAHPVILDACFQAFIGAMHGAEGLGDHPSAYLPVGYRRILVHGRLPDAVWCRVQLTTLTPKDMVAQLQVCDAAGNVLVDVRDFRCQAVDHGAIAADDHRDTVYSSTWRLTPRPGPKTLSRLTLPSALQQLPRMTTCRAAVPGIMQRQQGLAQAMARLSALYVARAFETLGFTWTPGSRFTTPELAERLGIADRHHRLLERYLDSFRGDGVMKKAGDTWEVIATLGDDDPHAVWQDLIARYPDANAELRLLQRSASRLAEMLRGDIDPLSILFPEGSVNLTEQFYQDSPGLACANALIQQAVASLVEQLPAGGTIRVLEIGAGTGGLTSHVISRFTPETTEYVFTDLSNSFFLKAAEKFADYPFIKYQHYNAEQDPAGQGLEPHSFNLVLASNVLHATSDLRQTMANASRLLAPGGVIMLLETVRPIRWFDLVFGLTEGWWRYSDLDLRPDYPLVSYPTWQRLLEESGFHDVQEGMGLPLSELDVSVILAARNPLTPEEIQAATEPSTAHPAPSAESNGHAHGEILTADTAATAEPTESAAAAPPASPLWLLFADAGGTAARLAAHLEQDGGRCLFVKAGDGYRTQAETQYAIRPGSADDMQQLLTEVWAAHGTPQGIVHLWNLDSPADAPVTLDSLRNSAQAGCLSLVHFVQAFAQVTSPQAPRLWIITQQAQAVGDAAEVAISQASAWGLGRVVANEMPRLQASLVDLGTADDTELQSLCAEFQLNEPEDEVVLRGQARYLHRFQRVADQNDSRVFDRVGAQAMQGFRLQSRLPGVLDKLALQEFRRQPPGPGEVEIEIAASGLNFSDVMKALGIYPGLPAGPVPLGIECAGTVSALGAGVDKLQVGDAVVAVVPFSFASHITMPACLVVRKPPQLSFIEAATIPVAFLTAYYALHHVGRMRRGERVLIHAATGGVGLAAIQLANLAGAEVYATAGSNEKREFLRSIGVKHVMDSRSLAFADEIMELTNGEGIDIVLNSLAGEAIRKNLAILRYDGRMLEIGKRDIYAGSRVSLLPFRNNLTLSTIDLDLGLRRQPEMLASLFQDVVRLFDDGRLRPLPYRVFSASNAIGAFRYMSQAKHLGKIVISFEERELAVVPAPTEPILFRAEGSYLITGGLGGFGLAISRWMVERGARHLVLMGRSGAATPAAQEAVESLRNLGADVVVVKGDATVAEDVRRALQELDASGRPLCGVMHGAMVLDDSLLMNMSDAAFWNAWNPKALGAWNLHEATKDRPLDFFLLLSSMSAMLGFGGQANYAAGNTMLDALARARSAAKLPGLSVNWGVLGEVGWVSQNADVAERLRSQGSEPLSLRQATGLLGDFLQRDLPQIGALRLDWRRFSESPGVRVPPRFAHLIPAEIADGEGRDRRKRITQRDLLDAPVDVRLELLSEHVRHQVARVLGVAPEELPLDVGLPDLGFDSLMAVELKNWIEGDLRLNLPVVELMHGTTVAQLIELLMKQLDVLAGGAAPAPAAAEPSVPAETPVEAAADVPNVDDMSDEEVDAMLAQLQGAGTAASPS